MKNRFQEPSPPLANDVAVEPCLTPKNFTPAQLRKMEKLRKQIDALRRELEEIFALARKPVT
jgi:hypothetical protein